MGEVFQEKWLMTEGYTMLCTWGAGNEKTLAHLPHYPCYQHRRFPWQRCIRALSSRSGRHTASCSDPVCISRCRCTNRGSHLVGEMQRMRRRGARPRWGSRGAMQRGSKAAGQPLGQPQSGARACLRKSRGSRQYMQSQGTWGPRCRGSPMTLTCVKGSEATFPKWGIFQKTKPALRLQA